MKFFKSVFKSINPVSVIFISFLISLLTMTIGRIILVILFLDRIKDVSLTQLFWTGLRMDVIINSYAFMFPAFIILVFSKKFINKYLKKILAFFLIAIPMISAILEMTTYQFIQEYDLRPDIKYVEYLKSTTEVFGMLWKAYNIQILFLIIAIISLFIIFSKITKNLILNYRDWSTPKKLIALVIVGILLALGGRSSFKHKPANISSAYFSSNRLANELALNSFYSLCFAIYRDLTNVEGHNMIYGKMEDSEVLERMKNLVPFKKEDIVEDKNQFLHKQISPFKYETPVNIVVVLMESVGASDVACLDGVDATPNLCKLKDEGLWFSNLYATGTRTARGIESVFTGFLPTTNSSIIKSELTRNGFFTIASLLKKHGYKSNFIYGGMSNFDDMKSFCLGNGMDDVIDEEDFENPSFKGTWGVSDEDLFLKANEVFKNQQKPFFSLLLTTSNHLPFEFPDGKIELFEEPKNTHFNSVKYSDFAISKFFENAKKEDYYKNTIFLLVADHNASVRGKDFVPIDQFHIPALMIGPNVPKMTFEKIASQIDLLPTLLHFSGLETVHPMIGRNLMTLPQDVEGRAFMQFSGNYAYRNGNDVIILRPKTTPVQFRVDKSDILSNQVEVNEALAKDALAYAYYPWYVLLGGIYK